ncbi:MAG: DUF1295 domain-containing protein [Clostridia bacterium]|nr:DUF1295 domain-containing protein [Clostridia bacterium]
MSGKRKGFLIDCAVYAAAFGIGLILFSHTDGIVASAAVLTLTATAVIWIATALLGDVSVYDPYWSVAPPVILLACVIRFGLWNVNAVVLLILTGLWSLRLTANWYETYPGLRREDWRYAMYRKKCSAPVFQLLSFFGLQLMPTVVVFAGMIGALHAIRRPVFATLSAVGAAVMLGAVLLEHAADTAIHRFLREHAGERRTCDISVWHWSRHPNYLGEMLFWTGLYLYFAACCPDIRVKGLGFLSIIALFLCVSIPMMEKHNLERRPDYAAYRLRTPALLPLPKKNFKTQKSL